MISVPNTFVVSTNVRAEQWNNNFAALQNGLSDGTQDLYVANVQVAHSFSAGNAAVGSRNITGNASGQRSLLVYANEHGITGTKTGYWMSNRGSSDVIAAPFGYVVPRSGSVVGWAYRVAPASAPVVTSTVSLDLKKNAATVLNLSTFVRTLTAGTASWTSYANYARGTYQFSAGDQLQLYVSGVFESAQNAFGMVLEVQYDT